MSAVAAVRDWVGSHPVLADGLLGALVLVPSALARPPQGRADVVVDLGPTAVSLLVVACAVLAFRRRFPWGVWGLTTLLGLVGVVVAGGPSQLVVPSIVAVFTLSTLESTRAAVATGLVTALAPVALILATSRLDLVDAVAYGLLPWSILAAVSGVAVRSQRATVAAAQERARHAEATREEEAQRQVAEERLRIARELHDVVAHHISVINVQAGVAGHLLRTDPDTAAAAIGHVREASRIVLDEVPGLLGLLRTGGEEPATAPAPGLAQAAELVEQARHSGLEVTWRTTGTPIVLSPAADLTAYRILQEALTNAARHGSGPADASVSYDAEGCTLVIANDRQVPAGEAGTAHHGLVGMRERAGSVGGTLEVGPAGPHQWLVRARLPLRSTVARSERVGAWG